MTITKKSDPAPTTKFGETRYGSTFLYEGAIWMTIEARSGLRTDQIMIARLSDGMVKIVGMDAKAVFVEGEFVW